MSTTTDFYSGAGNGRVMTDSTKTSWAAAWNATTGTYEHDLTVMGIKAGKFSSSDYRISRCHVPFDTSAIPSNATITAATLYITNQYSIYNYNSRYGNIILSTMSNVSGTVAADFIAFGTTRFCDADVLCSSASKALRTFVLNASGIAAIVKAGWTKLGVKCAFDIDNTAPTNDNNSYFYTSQAEGTADDPKLTVTYTVLITKSISTTLSIARDVIKKTDKELADSISVAAFFLKFFREIGQSLTLTTINEKVTRKVISEPLSVSPTILKSYFKIMSVLMSLSSSIRRARIFETIISLNGSIKRATTRVIDKTINLSESFIKKTTRSISTVITLGLNLLLLIPLLLEAGIALTGSISSMRAKIVNLTIGLSLSFKKSLARAIQKSITLTLNLLLLIPILLEAGISLAIKATKVTRKSFSESISLSLSFLKTIMKVFNKTLSLTLNLLIEIVQLVVNGITLTASCSIAIITLIFPKIIDFVTDKKTKISDFINDKKPKIFK
jgi:hypothetical protein